MTRTGSILRASSTAVLIGLLLLPNASMGQAAGMPASAGAALRSGWQLVHFSVGYVALPEVATAASGLITTRFGSDEVYYFLLRKESSYIVCYQQLGRSPGVAAYGPWKRECLAVQ